MPITSKIQTYHDNYIMYPLRYCLFAIYPISGWMYLLFIWCQLCTLFSHFQDVGMMMKIESVFSIYLLPFFELMLFLISFILIQVGEFYEAIGFDACVLVEYAGLNPFGGLRSDSIPRAGCPVMVCIFILLIEKGVRIYLCL